MAKKVSLDPRPARKLTSRECSKLIGGVLGGLCSLLGKDMTREALEALETEEYWKLCTTNEHQAFQHLETSCSPELKVACRALGGATGGLLTMAGKRSVRTAIKWWLQEERAWEYLARCAEHGEAKGLS